MFFVFVRWWLSRPQLRLECPIWSLGQLWRAHSSAPPCSGAAHPWVSQGKSADCGGCKYAQDLGLNLNVMFPRGFRNDKPVTDDSLGCLPLVIDCDPAAQRSYSTHQHNRLSTHSLCCALGLYLMVNRGVFYNCGRSDHFSGLRRSTQIIL